MKNKETIRNGILVIFIIMILMISGCAIFHAPGF